MEHTVYSTLSSSVTYENHAATHDMPKVIASVTINGGANVIGEFLITPKGVATMVSEEELEALEANPVFQLHKANGFVKVESGKRGKREVEVAVADLQAREPSAPAVAEDLQNLPEPVEVNTVQKKK